MPRVGRRTFFIWGLIGVGTFFLIVGGLGVRQASAPSSGLSWAVGGLLLVSVFIVDISVAPLSYTLVSEIPSSLLRKKSVVIARFCYATVNIVANVLTPYQLNPTAWGWGARSGSFWAGSCALLLIFTYFFVPEPKDRPIAELDLLFEKKVSARNFSKPKSTYPRAQRTKMQLDILRSGSAEVRILRAYHLFDEAKSQRASRGPVC